MARETGLALYNRTAVETSAVVIRSYSTSFGLASRLLPPRTRSRIETVYALVRLADEIVDGVAAAAGLPPAEVARLLDALEADTVQALHTGYSVNLVVHAFALTARSTGITEELTAPFFRSMRADLERTEHTPESFTDYVYGSAEVIGLMCLLCFLQDSASASGSASASASASASGSASDSDSGADADTDRAKRLKEGAQRLGAAFQKVNFLRDLADDFDTLGRSYFPGITVAAFAEADKHRLLDDIDADLRVSGAAIAELPPASRAAVALAQELFTELSRRLRATPADRLRSTRVRVPNPVKLRIAAGIVYTHRLRRPAPCGTTAGRQP